MDRILEPSDSGCCTPSLELIRFYLKEYCFIIMHKQVKGLLLNVFIFATDFATDLNDTLYTSNEIPWKQLEVPGIGCWSKSNSPLVGLLYLSLWMQYGCNGYPTDSRALELLRRKQVTLRKGEDDEWVRGYRGASFPLFSKKFMLWDELPDTPSPIAK
jgi:hypothetical protein